MATSDGGKSWHQKAQPAPDVLRDIFFIDDQNGWLVCEVNIYELKRKDDQRTYLMKTTDGGQTWKRIDISGAEVDVRLLRAVFSQGGRGWAFGKKAPSSQRATLAKAGLACDRRPGVYFWAAHLLTTTAGGWLAPLPQSFRHQMEEIPGIFPV